MLKSGTQVFLPREEFILRSILLYRARGAEGEMAQLLGNRSHHGGRLERNGVIHPWRHN